ncbi:hypothetical protein [Candidatus Spongiihabitans sp.]
MRGFAGRHILTGFPPAARMTGWGDNGKSGGNDFFETPKVNEKKESRFV